MAIVLTVKLGYTLRLQLGLFPRDLARLLPRDLAFLLRHDGGGVQAGASTASFGWTYVRLSETLLAPLRQILQCCSNVISQFFKIDSNLTSGRRPLCRKE